jgi:hypothetical protein
MSIDDFDDRTLKDFYSNKLEYPTHSTFGYSIAKQKAIEHAKRTGVLDTNEYTKKMDELMSFKASYKKAQIEYDAETQRLHRLFKSDLFEYVGGVKQNSSQGEKAFNMAWERGRSEGLYRVSHEFYELAELIKLGYTDV